MSTPDIQGSPRPAPAANEKSISSSKIKEKLESMEIPEEGGRAGVPIESGRKLTQVTARFQSLISEEKESFAEEHETGEKRVHSLKTDSQSKLNEFIKTTEEGSYDFSSSQWSYSLDSHRFSRKKAEKVQEYVMTNRLGAGAFGVVYEINPEEGTKKAMKRFSASDIEWAKEIKILQKIYSSNRQKLVGIELPPKSLILNHRFVIFIKPLYETDLKKMLVKEKLSDSQGKEAILQIMQGVATLYRKGIISRDVAVDNIFVRGNKDGSTRYDVSDLGYCTENIDAEESKKNLLLVAQVLDSITQNVGQKYFSEDFLRFTDHLKKGDFSDVVQAYEELLKIEILKAETQS